jgi:hypothetical protein
MKKTLLTIGVMIIFGLTISGCGVKKPLTTDITTEPGTSNPVTNDNSNTPDANNPADTNNGNTDETKNEEKVDPGVTQKDLNGLKSDIEKMNYEDLNALSN